MRATLARFLPEEIRTYEEERGFPNEPGFRPLFNGYDLTGWEGDDRVWSVKGGVIVGECPEGVDAENTPLVWRGSKPVDFELRARFQLEQEDLNTNAAIAYRADEAGKNWLGINLNSSRVGNIRSPGGIGSSLRNRAPRYRAGEWNDVRMILKGEQATHAANGKFAYENFTSDQLRESGRILLVAPAAGHGRVKFTDIRLRDTGRP